jgi:hypothetical protein
LVASSARRRRGQPVQPGQGRSRRRRRCPSCRCRWFVGQTVGGGHAVGPSSAAASARASSSSRRARRNVRQLSAQAVEVVVRPVDVDACVGSWDKSVTAGARGSRGRRRRRGSEHSEDPPGDAVVGQREHVGDAVGTPAPTVVDEPSQRRERRAAWR